MAPFHFKWKWTQNHIQLILSLSSPCVPQQWRLCSVWWFHTFIAKIKSLLEQTHSASGLNPLSEKSFLPRGPKQGNLLTNQLFCLFHTERITEVLLYHYVLLPSAVLLMGQVFIDHICLYKPIMHQWYRLQIQWDNMFNERTKHDSSFQMFDITVYWFHVNLHLMFTMWHFFMSSSLNWSHGKPEEHGKCFMNYYSNCQMNLSDIMKQKISCLW